MKGRKRVALAAGFVLAILGCASIALATMTAKHTIPPDGRAVFILKCPPGSHVVQGGMSGEINGQVFSPGVEIDYEEDIHGNLTGVSAEFYNYGQGPSQIELFLRCSNGDPPVKIVTSTTTVAPNSHGVATATCPSGTTVRYGGFKTTFAQSGKGAQITPEALTRPTARTWRVAGFNYRGPAGPLEAIAYCGTGPSLTPHTKTITVPSYQQAYATASCPQGQQVLLGGFSAPYSGNGPVFDSMDAPTKGTWKVGVFDYSPKPTNHLTAIAYCG